jgi:hypothetical protein
LPGALDGVFSIGVSDVVGSLELSILAAAEGGDPAILNNAPIITRQGAIPEPATLSLLGFALAVIAACRRSQRKSVAGL